MKTPPAQMLLDFDPPQTRAADAVAEAEEAAAIGASIADAPPPRFDPDNDPYEADWQCPRCNAECYGTPHCPVCSCHDTAQTTYELSHSAATTFDIEPFDYDPSHPWYYLQDGDNQEPCHASAIPTADRYTDCLAAHKKYPKTPAKRIKALREALDRARAFLEERTARYEDVRRDGAMALSEYDREIAYGGNHELARACALSFLYSHISNARADIQWLEDQLAG